MKTTKNATKNTKNVIEAPKRGRGRPASFPGIETVAFLAKIPQTSREMVRELAKKRGENIDQTLAKLIERGHKDAFRSRAKAKAKATTEA